MIGTDLKSISTLVYGGGEYYSWPVAPGVPGYTPFNQLPAVDQELYNYDAAKAKKMISDAGYPNGFKVEIMVANSNQQQIDLANLLVSMWAKINVTANINLADPTVLATMSNQTTFKDTLIQNSGVVNPLTTLNLGRAATTTYGLYVGDGSDPQGTLQEKMYVDMSATVDPIQRTAKLQALALTFMDDVGTFGFTNAYTLNCYWPWFKNYYGELDASYYNEMPMIMRGWIDQNLKKSLGK
jgi:peptide/nickel transport system substrate-binding protein